MTFRPGRDYLFPYYRDLTTCVAAGLTAEEILLNGMSKATDVASGGRHMSNHFAKPSIGIQNVSSCVSNHSQHAAGLARAIKTYRKDAIVFCSVGESSTSEGYFYEAVNGASREKLPVVFVVQDNAYGISVPKSDQTANLYASDNFTGFKNLKIIHCDGLDVFDSFRAMREAVAFVRSGAGAAIVHATCVRIHSHSNSDRHELYRTPEELAEAQSRGSRCRASGACCSRPGSCRRRICARSRQQNERTYEEAADRAKAAPEPDPATIHDFVVPEPWVPSRVAGGTARRLRRGDDARPGPERDAQGGVPAQLRHVHLGPGRRLPGQGRRLQRHQGHAAGVRTVARLQRTDRRGLHHGHGGRLLALWTTGSASSSRARSSPTTSGRRPSRWSRCRTNTGARTASSCPTSRCASPRAATSAAASTTRRTSRAGSTTLPGIRIVVPAFADDAAGLLRTAIRSRGITLYLEPKFLYNNPMARARVPAEFAVPFGKARVRREGTDLTIVAYGTPVHFALEAARVLEKDGKSVEVIDLRSLVPLDWDAVLASVRKTSRVLVAHEDKVHGGFGGEIAAQIQERAFAFLDAPVGRVGSEFTPVGFIADPGAGDPAVVRQGPGGGPEGPGLLTGRMTGVMGAPGVPAPR